MKKNGMVVLLLAMFLTGFPPAIMAAERTREIHDAGEIQFRAKGDDEAISQTPGATIISVERYNTPGVPQSITDILKDRAIIDFRGATDLVPDDDTIYLRGYSSSRFVTALDSLTVQKTGGRKSSHIVDYALLPAFLIERIEILPGPHSALYPGKSIGGVLNLITKTPQRYDSLKPDVDIAASYRSYGTQNHTMSAQGGIDSFIYDLGFQKSLTDGYLRYTEADIETVFGRIGYIFPSDGYLTLSASYSDADRQIAVNNDPGESDYDSGDPDVTGSAFDPWQQPTWDKEAYSYRLNFNHPTPIGLWSMRAYTSKENRHRDYWDYINKKKPDEGIHYTRWETVWWQHGGRIQDELRIDENHLSTFGFEMAQMYDNGSGEKTERIRTQGGYLQHQWDIIPRLSLTAGLRYENVRIWVQNYDSSTGDTYISGRENWIKRNWDEWVPKSFLTYEMDDISPRLRDTSVSLGVSKIWHAPDYHGVYNPQGKPSGAWLDPEHGVGVDFVVTRRLVKDIQLRVNYSYSEIEDYIASNRTYSQYTPSGSNPVTPGLEYSDYKINLEKVVRNGLDIEIDGHLFEKLSFSVGYAFQEFDNKGDEPGGEEEVDQRAKHRVNANLCYELFEGTKLQLGYEFQDDQVTEKSEEIAPDEWVFEEIAMDAFHVFDFGVEQTLFDTWGPVRNGVLKLYIMNIFDEGYETSEGYPATDRTVGIALSFGL